MPLVHCPRIFRTLSPYFSQNVNRATGPWDAYLAGVETDAAAFDRLRSHQQTGRPLGSDAFVAELEAQTKRILTPRRAGRPRKTQANTGQLDLWSGE